MRSTELVLAIGIGETLRTAREEAGRTVDEAARDTRVRADYLRALEDEEFGAFGGDVYAKGFLSTYARYLGLDTAPLLEQYRRYVQKDDYDPARIAANPVASAPRDRPPAWIAWAAIAIVVVVAGVALTQLLGSRNPEPAVQPAPQPVASSPTPTPSPTAAASPSPSPTFDGVNLVLLFEDDSWLRVTIDGKDVLETTIRQGESLQFQDDEAVSIRFGNPGGVRVELNGQDVGFAGEPGRPVSVTYTPDGPAPAA